MSVALSRPMRTSVCVLVFVLSACVASSVSLIQLDNEWTRTYKAKLEAEGKDADYLASSASYDAQLADLSDRAAKAADEALGHDPQAAIGLYRVAAAAAWQSGALREDRTVALSDKGLNACESLPKKAASQPRDCEFLKLVPQLALYDRSARTIKALKDRDAGLNAEEASQGLQLVDSVAKLIAQLDAERTAAQALPLPPSFTSYVETNLVREYCAILGLSGRLFASQVTEPQKEALRASVSGARKTLEDAHIATTCN
jgi:hypothetical protein